MRPSVPVADNKAVETTGLAETAGPAAVSRPPRAPRPRDVVILGSTGSIGTQAADVIRRNPGRFQITGVAAGGGDPRLLASQAVEFGAKVVAVARESAAGQVRAALAAAGARPMPEVLAGADGIAEAAARPCDVVLNAVTGFSGLAATLAALRAGRVLALANKESLIAGGPLVADLAAPGHPAGTGRSRSARSRPGRSGRARPGRPPAARPRSGTPCWPGPAPGPPVARRASRSAR